MQELKPGLTVEQLGKLRVKAYKASQKAHDIWFRDKWLQIAESARTMKDALDINTADEKDESTYSAGISEDTEPLQNSTVDGNNGLTYDEILKMLEKKSVRDHINHGKSAFSHSLQDLVARTSACLYQPTTDYDPVERARKLIKESELPELADGTDPKEVTYTVNKTIQNTPPLNVLGETYPEKGEMFQPKEYDFGYGAILYLLIHGYIRKSNTQYYARKE